MNKIFVFLGIILAGTLLFPACANQRGDVWNERPAREGRQSRETRKQKRDHLRYVLSKVVLVRMNAKGQICIGEDDSALGGVIPNCAMSSNFMLIRKKKISTVITSMSGTILIPEMRRRRV